MEQIAEGWPSLEGNGRAREIAGVGGERERPLCSREKIKAMGFIQMPCLTREQGHGILHVK